MTTDKGAQPGLDRRTLVRGVATGALALPLLAACSTTPAVTVHQTHRLVPVKDVPVGGGLVLASQVLVVTQPVEGELKGFSAICTHRQCLLGTVDNGMIHCPCHGSAFDIKTGRNVIGPQGAPAGTVKPLTAIPVKLHGTEVVRAGPIPPGTPVFDT